MEVNKCTILSSRSTSMIAVFNCKLPASDRQRHFDGIATLDVSLPAADCCIPIGFFLFFSSLLHSPSMSPLSTRVQCINWTLRCCLNKSDYQLPTKVRSLLFLIQFSPPERIVATRLWPLVSSPLRLSRQKFPPLN